MARKKIWHYTNFVALNGILINGELRLCNTKGMNDKKEMLSFVSGIEAALIHEYPQEEIRIRQVFREQKKKRENENVYGSSFSLLCNDAAQWERYGFDGRGVSIGFDLELFEKIREPYLLEQVSYRKDFRNYDFLSILPERVMHENFTDELFGDRDTVFRNLWACSGAYKDYSFKSEQEIRLMTLPVSPDSPIVRQGGKIEEGMSEEDLPPYEEIQYEIMDEKIREYMNFYIKERCKRHGVDFQSLITDIIIGPKSSQSLIILKNFLNKNGLSKLAEKVFRSDCPLR